MTTAIIADDESTLRDICSTVTENWPDLEIMDQAVNGR